MNAKVIIDGEHKDKIGRIVAKQKSTGGRDIYVIQFNEFRAESFYRDEIELVYVDGALNSCATNGVLCEHLVACDTDENILKSNAPKGIGMWCKWHNECGRGMCKDYEPKQQELEASTP